MKTKWNKTWKSSTQPRKQRKYIANAPLHIRRKMLGAHLSKELRVKYKKRSFPVRKGDKVKILRGQFKGTIGDIDKVDRKRYKVFVTGAEIKKTDGTKKHFPIHPSKLMILTLKLEDKKRAKALERK